MKQYLQGEVVGLTTFLVAIVIIFSVASPNFFTMTTFSSMAYQLPALGLLTLAMMIPILSGGLNLAITYTANISGLAPLFGSPVSGGHAVCVERRNGPGRLAPLHRGGTRVHMRRARSPYATGVRRLERGHTSGTCQSPNATGF